MLNEGHAVYIFCLGGAVKERLHISHPLQFYKAVNRIIRLYGLGDTRVIGTLGMRLCG